MSKLGDFAVVGGVIGGVSALAGAGLYVVGPDLISTINNASPQEAEFLKRITTVVGATVGANEGAFIVRFHRENHNLGTLGVAAACFGALVGGCGANKAADAYLESRIEKPKSAHTVILPSNQIPAARIPAQFKLA